MVKCLYEARKIVCVQTSACQETKAAFTGAVRRVLVAIQRVFGAAEAFLGEFQSILNEG